MPRYADLATVTRQDIRAFDTDAKRLVDMFHAAGWRSYMSNNSHAIFQAPDGVTTASVSGHNDKAQVRRGRAELDRWLRQNDNAIPMSRQERRKSKASRGKFRKRSFEQYPKPEHKSVPYPKPEHDNRVQEFPMAKFPCPDCPDREPMKSAGAYNLHRQRVHEGMICPECKEAGVMEVFLGGGNASKYNEHRLEKHGVIPKKKTSQRAPDGNYPCEFPGCPASFTTKLGRGGHMKAHKNPRNNVPKQRPALPTLTPVKKKSQPAPVEQPKPAQPAALAAPPSRPVTLIASGTSTDLDAWLAGQNPADLLANVLAVLAPPLVGEVERLRRQRDALTEEVETLKEVAETMQRKNEDYETRMTLIREAHKAQDEAMNL